MSARCDVGAWGSNTGMGDRPTWCPVSDLARPRAGRVARDDRGSPSGRPVFSREPGSLIPSAGCPSLAIRRAVTRVQAARHSRSAEPSLECRLPVTRDPPSHHSSAGCPSLAIRRAVTRLQGARHSCAACPSPGRRVVVRRVHRARRPTAAMTTWITRETGRPHARGRMVYASRPCPRCTTRNGRSIWHESDRRWDSAGESAQRHRGVRFEGFSSR